MRGLEVENAIVKHFVKGCLLNEVPQRGTRNHQLQLHPSLQAFNFLFSNTHHFILCELLDLASNQNPSKLMRTLEQIAFQSIFVDEKILG